MKTVLQYLRPQYARLALQLTIKFIGTITELFLPIVNRCKTGIM